MIVVLDPKRDLFFFRDETQGPLETLVHGAVGNPARRRHVAEEEKDTNHVERCPDGGNSGSILHDLSISTQGTFSGTRQ